MNNKLYGPFNNRTVFDHSIKLCCHLPHFLHQSSGCPHAFACQLKIFLLDTQHARTHTAIDAKKEANDNPALPNKFVIQIPTVVQLYYCKAVKKSNVLIFQTSDIEQSRATETVRQLSDICETSTVV